MSRRKIIPLIAKANEALVEASFNAKKAEGGDNLVAALDFARDIRDFNRDHVEPLYRLSKEIVSEIKQRPKRKVSAKQKKALQITRSKIKKYKK